MTIEVPTPAWERCTRERLLMGDESELGECYDQYASFVYGLVLRVVRDAKGAEDITPDVFLGLWETQPASIPRRERCAPGSARIAVRVTGDEVLAGD